MKKNINKSKPVIMLEANKYYFNKINKLFKNDYVPMEYIHGEKKFLTLKKMKYDASTYNKIKNYFLVPKKFLKNKNNLNFLF